ncbi:MAG: hypothetical protein ACYCX6_09925 [Vulcanimicrobiaceae bacterium]
MSTKPGQLHDDEETSVRDRETRASHKNEQDETGLNFYVVRRGDVLADYAHPEIKQRAWRSCPNETEENHDRKHDESGDEKRNELECVRHVIKQAHQRLRHRYTCCAVSECRDAPGKR